jgi:3-oxosteroid 1-dehydrogenase
VLKDGKLVNIKASKGVLLAAGGMGRNVEMRQEYGQLPTGEGWSSDSPGNVGDGIRMGLEVGAAVEFMGSAWWTPSVKTPDGVMMALISGKSMPGSFFVDGSGKRFCNEAAPYEDVVKEFWKNQARGISTVPSYMVFDARFRHEYMAGPVAPGKVQPDAALPKEYLETGFLKKADSIEALSMQLGIEAGKLMETVERHNQFAATGKDLDFGRGDSSHDRYYSDTSITPNPNLAPLVKAPYYAMEIYPGDLGTKGGLKFDSSARVLNQDDEVIEGLYVTGNCAGSVMGDSYPGAGSTIGPSMTFGYVAAKHALNSH